MLLVRSYVDQHNIKFGWLVTGILQRTCLALGTPTGLESGGGCAEDLPGMKRTSLHAGMKNLKIPRQE